MNHHAHDLIPTRRSLLSRLKDWGDEVSWGVFYDTYSGLIYKTAIKAGLSQAEAEDVVQETVLTVANNIKDFKYDPAVGSFKGWLLLTTRWRIADQMRQRNHAPSPGPEREREGAPSEPAGNEMECFWNQEWEKAVMDAAIARVKTQVKPRQYQMFDLCVLQKNPAPKAAEMLGVHITRVYFSVRKVSGLLKKELKRMETQLI